MTRLFHILVFYFACASILAQSNTKLSLITCDPGDELYSAFGHSAVRLRDDSLGLDVAFNYGTFDFKTPGFYQKFLQGKLLYTLSVSIFDSFLREYQVQHRGVVEQEFVMTDVEKEKFITFLKENTKPENRSYKYDFFFDNCSTRIRDGFEKNKDNKLSYVSTESGLSFRDYLHRYLLGKPWIRLGIDLIIGSKADKEASLQNQMFLPDRLMMVMTQSKVVHEGTQILSFDLEKKERNIPTFFSPSLFFLLLTLLALTLYTMHKTRSLHILRKLVYVTAFIGSLTIVFLWFFTDHQATKLNWNLLWLNPTYILLLRGRYKKPMAILNIILILVCSTTYFLNSWQMMQFGALYMLLLVCLYSEIKPKVVE